LGPLAEMLDESVDSFRNLSSSGASFNNSITEMRYAAATAELSLGEFQSFVGNNTESLRLLGGTVTEGVQRFTQVNRALKQNEALYSGLKNMGFTVEEINEGLADYTQLQSRLGMLEGQSNQQLATGAANYMKELDALAKITGRQRDEIAQSMEQNAADASFRAIAGSLEAQFGPDSQQLQNFNSSMALIDSIGGSTAIALKDLADGVPQTAEGIALLNTAGPEVAEAMRAVAQGADPQTLIDALAAAGDSIDGFAGEGGDAAAFISSIRDSNPAMAAILDEAFRLKQIGSQNFEEAKAEQERREDINQTLTTFDDRIRDVRGALARAFLDSGLLDLIVSGLEHFANFISGFGEGLVSFVNDISNGDFLSAIGGAFKDAIKLAIENPGVTAAIAAVFAGPAILKAAAGGVTSLFGGLMGGGGDAPSGGGGRRGGGRRGGGRGAGGGMGRGIGGFMGGMAGGVMEGAATGLKAFGKGSAQILLGAATVAGVITAIGAGIGAASWILGETLPGFIDGIKKFEELDGGALIDAATGMLAISGAMAAFGAGSAVAGVGALVGGITEGIVGLFGGEDPMEKLQRFASYDIDAAKVENNAKAMVAFSTAMAAQGAGSAVSGVGSLVGGIADGITSFFGGETGFPYAKITEFASYDIDSAKVEANARALVAFNNALMTASAGTAVSGIGTMVGAIGDFVGGLFGGESPIEQVKSFGEMDINAEGVRTNAEAMVAMSNALSSLSGEGISDIEIPSALVDRFEEIAAINGTGFSTTAEGLQALANVSGLSAMVTSLNSLDATQLSSYNTAMENLVSTLEELNDVLSETNEGGLFNEGSGVAAADVLGQIGGSTAGSNQQLVQLNNTMMQVLEVLREQYDVQEETARGTRRLQGNLIAG
jgi:hypothetical protein